MASRIPAWPPHPVIDTRTRWPTTCSSPVKSHNGPFTLVTDNGFSPDDIHHLTVYVVGERQNLVDAWDGVSEWFQGNVPPATLLGVARLGYEHQLVEVDANIMRG